MPFPSGRPARYGNVRPTDYLPCIGTITGVRPFTLRTSPFTLPRPFLPPVSIPPSMASAFVFGSASMHSQFQFHHPSPTPTALAIQAGERILLRHCGGIVPPLSSSNVFDNATRHRDSNVQHWNIFRSSAGLQPFYFGHVHYPAVSVGQFPERFNQFIALASASICHESNCTHRECGNSIS